MTLLFVRSYARLWALLMVPLLGGLLPEATIPALALASAPLYVATDGDDDRDCLAPSAPCRTINRAISAASSGARVQIAAGVYSESLIIEQDVNLSGAGAGLTIIEGSGTGRVVDVVAGMTVGIAGVTIRNGFTPDDGGAIRNAGTLTVENSSIRANQAGLGAGMYNAVGATLTLRQSQVSNNQTTEPLIDPTNDDGGGGGIANRGTLRVENSSFTANRATDYGGGIMNFGSASISGSAFFSNTAGFAGGGFYTNLAAPTIVNSTFFSNTAGTSGGGLGSGGPNSQPAVSFSTFVGNGAPDGGNIGLLDSPQLSLTASILANPIQGQNCAGAIAATTASLQFPGTSCGVAVSSADPRLGPLDERAGPTPSFGLLAGSPAIDLGSAVCPRTDQRAILRPQGLACDSGAVEAPLVASSPAGLTENEPNDLVAQANALGLDPAGQIQLSGAITPAGDVDWYVLTADPGATIAVSLTTAGADLDLALLGDLQLSQSTATVPISDGVSLKNIKDPTRIDESGQIVSVANSAAIDLVNAISRRDVSNQLVGLSTSLGTLPESISATLSQGGSYYLLVYSSLGTTSLTPTYALTATVQGSGSAPQALSTAADIVGSLNPTLTVDSTVRTIYLQHTDRMRSSYPAQTAVVDELNSLLAPGSALIQASSGVVVDLSSSAQLGVAQVARLDELYRQWDARPDSVAAANELALQIWFILDRALTNYYTGTTDIVLVGGDPIIPFYRIRDQTVVANESDYFGQLQNGLAATAPLSASLRGGFIQTDNFYADRQPTPWLDRALYIPDLGIGRLVEQPSEIVAYLSAYTSADSFVVQADRVGTNAGAAFVSGYRYVGDAASAIAEQLRQFGFNPGDAAATRPGLTTLTSDTWTLEDFSSLWFGPQPPTGSYSGLTGRNYLTAINGHFSHYQLFPADDAAIYTADQLLAASSADLANPYFKIAGSPVLIYTIGCQAGLNVPDDAVVRAELAADFASAVLKNGGNWIGNTGFGYADREQIGYSERLGLLFTQAIGRRIDAGGAYAGAAVGESLARAKREYLQNIGPGGFSVFDEKVLAQMTIFGLPFLRVKVPNPTPAPLDAPATAIPPALTAALTDTVGSFTRIITLTSSFDPATISGGQVPTLSVQIEDSFVPTPTLLTSTVQVALGRPALPLVTYDITMLPPFASSPVVPQVRGVRLLDAASLPFGARSPSVTRLITEPLRSDQDGAPALTARGIWFPDVPYTTQRTSRVAAGVQVLADRLVVNLVQFNAASQRQGWLRIFTRIVVEVSYLEFQTGATRLASCPDCNAAAITIVALKCNPELSVYGCGKVRRAGQGSVAQTPADPQTSQPVYLYATVPNVDPASIDSVQAVYTTDGIDWARRRMERNPTLSDTYQYELTALPGSIVDVFFEVTDKTGTVTVSAGRSYSTPFSRLYLPFVRQFDPNERQQIKKATQRTRTLPAAPPYPAPARR